MNDVRWTAVSSGALRSFELVGEILDARLDVGLQVFGALVLGNRAQHLAQPFETLARLTRFAKGGLGGLVLGAEVGGHRKETSESDNQMGCYSRNSRLGAGVAASWTWGTMRSSVAREQEPSNKRSDDLPSELSIAVCRKNSGRMQFGVLQQNRPKQVRTVRFKEARETGHFDSPPLNCQNLYASWIKRSSDIE